MALSRMVGKEDYETRLVAQRDIRKVSDYQGHEEGAISHAPQCVHNAELEGSPRCVGGYYVEGAGLKGWSEIRVEGLYPDCVTASFDAAGGYHRTCSGPMGALYMETTHVGVVLALRERNGYDDSDFYALCWNAAEGRPEEIWYATTRGWTYPNNAWVDATPDVIAAHDAYREAQRVKYVAQQVAERAAAAERERVRPARGKVVRVVRGRKVPVGVVGNAFWEGVDGWGKSRLGIKTADGTVHWTAASNCEVVAK